MEDQWTSLTTRLGELLMQHGYTLACAESCTGGWVAKLVTDIAGSSQWFDRGFVTYSNLAKQEMLGVREETLLEHGAVSEETVVEMAAGAQRHSRAQVSLAISGIAGPGGGSADKPVGMVCLAWSVEQQVSSTSCYFQGDRDAVRRQAVTAALQGMLDRLETD